MAAAKRVNRRVLLERRPKGVLRAADFRMQDALIPQVRSGELLIRNFYLSLDPAYRLWAREKASYMPSVNLGDVMRGFAMGVVEKSRNPKFPVGSIVAGMLGWEEYSVADGNTLLSIVNMDARLPLVAAFGLFEHIGPTAYFGVLDILRPRAGETMVVSGAAGAVGSIAVQIGKIMRCRVVAIAGSDEKCRWLTEELGADAAVNYKKAPLRESLPACCPNGIDTFFDNVGGETLEVVLDHLAMNARIAMCGAISQYSNDETVYAPQNIYNLLMKRARMEGFIVLDYAVDRRWWAKAHDDLTTWHLQGRLKYRLDIVEGLENAAKAVTRLFDGRNTGKLVVKIGEEPLREVAA